MTAAAPGVPAAGHNAAASVTIAIIRVFIIGTSTPAGPAGVGQLAADAAQAKLRELVASAAGKALVLDGTSLSYVSSAGLRVFLTIAKEAKAAGVAVAVGALQPAVKQVFDISGFSQTKIIDVHPTVDDAVRAVAR